MSVISWIEVLIVYCHHKFIFFFKQKTAYEMRISDWSSDVCSSDLNAGSFGRRLDQATPSGVARSSIPAISPKPARPVARSPETNKPLRSRVTRRSEERRVGKEWVSPCRSRWSTYH